MFTVTPKAASKIQALLQKQGKPGGFLRVSVASGGCAGLEYKLDIDDTPLPGEEVYDCGGARVAADFKVKLYMGGSTIDYKESLMKSGFEISNPQAVMTCSCGTSFTT